MPGEIDIHLGILSEHQGGVFQRMTKALADSGFYLAGGTALALQIGHLMRSLVHFANAESEPEIKTVRPFHWQKMKDSFEGWVRDLSV